MKNINSFRKGLVLAFCAALVALAIPIDANAQTGDNRTIVTFSETIEIPGVGQKYLPAGTYVFKLVDSLSNRDIVQILSEDESKVFATILSIANYRLESTDKTVITFRERPVGQPEAIRAWFYPGKNWGQEFVYPKTRAIELAKVTQEPILYVPSEVAVEMAKPIPTVTLREVPIRAVTPAGQDVEIAEVVEPVPARQRTVAVAPQPERRSTLPETASPLPLVGLIGLLALSGGLALSFFKRNVF